MRSRGSLTIAGVASLALVLVGCAGGTSTPELSYEDSPLYEYLGAAFGGDLSPEEQQKQIDEQQREVEELVAQCMKDEGFEYTPNIEGMSASIADDDGELNWDPENKEWVEKYGYGIVNNPYMASGSDEEVVDDPNQETIDKLTESEQTAYYEALHGAPTAATGEDGEGGSFEYDWESAGCQGWAQNEVQGDQMAMFTEFSDLMEKMSTLYQETQDSPELADLNREWSTCMEEAGESGFAKQGDAQQSIMDAQEELYGGDDGLTPEGDGSSGEGDTGAGIDTSAPAPDELEDPQNSPEMKELGEREIALALVDLECRQKTDYADQALKVQFALEEKFIADNKAELDAFKAAAEQSS